MSFWDSSAVVPSLIDEESSRSILAILSDDTDTAYWWPLVVECASSLWRRRREGLITNFDVQAASQRLDEWLARANCVEPSVAIRSRACALLGTHGLRAADALQLSAALAWSGDHPSGKNFVCLDSRLRIAALREGFSVLPPEA